MGYFNLFSNVRLLIKKKHLSFEDLTLNFVAVGKKMPSFKHDCIMYFKFIYKYSCIEDLLLNCTQSYVMRYWNAVIFKSYIIYEKHFVLWRFGLLILEQVGRKWRYLSTVIYSTFKLIFALTFLKLCLFFPRTIPFLVNLITHIPIKSWFFL